MSKKEVTVPFVDKVIARRAASINSLKKVKAIADAHGFDTPLPLTAFLKYLEFSPIDELSRHLRPIAHLADDLRLLNVKLFDLDGEGRERYFEYVRTMAEASLDVYRAFVGLASLEQKSIDFVIPEDFIPPTAADYACEESRLNRCKYVAEEFAKYGWTIIQGMDLFQNWIKSSGQEPGFQVSDLQADSTARWSAYDRPQEPPILPDNLQSENTEN